MSAGWTTQSWRILLQEKHQQKSRTACSELLSLLLDSADWLFIFSSSGVYIFILWVDFFFFCYAWKGLWFCSIDEVFPSFANLEKSVYQPITQVVSDDFTRLKPWSFYRFVLFLSCVFFSPTLTTLWPWSFGSVWILMCLPWQLVFPTSIYDKLTYWMSPR